VVAPVESYSIPKRKATPFVIVHLIHCRRKWVGDLSLKGRVGVLADCELDGRRQMVLPSVLESIQHQPARPFSEGIAHLVFTNFNKISLNNYNFFNIFQKKKRFRLIFGLVSFKL
jgi:hypothetical protein